MGNYVNESNLIEKFAGSPVDLVFSSHSLEHINPSSLENLLGALSKIIAPGGHLFFEVPDDLTYKGLFPPHTLFFTFDSIKNLVDRFGFDIVDLSRWDGGARWVDEDSQNTSALSVEEKGEIRNQKVNASLRSFVKTSVLGTSVLRKLIKPLVVRLMLQSVLRRMSAPYEDIPYYRVIARKKKNSANTAV